MLYADLMPAAVLATTVGGGLLWLMQTTLAPLRDAVERLLAAERSLEAALERNRREIERLTCKLAALEERLRGQEGRLGQVERGMRHAL
mgnify:CR=1 FL=1